MKHTSRSPEKRTRGHRQRVCMMCGKPSKETICEPCKSRVQSESLHRKIQSEKLGKP